jgi:hypothetical protein
MSILVVPGYDDRRVYCTHPSYDSIIEYDGIMNKKVKFYSEHRVGNYSRYDGVTMTLSFNPDSVEITLDRKMMNIMMNIMYKKCDGVIKVIRDSSYVYSDKEGYYIPPRLEPTKIIETHVLNHFLSHDFESDEYAFISKLFNDYGVSIAYAYLKCPDDDGNVSSLAVK